jgi:hypothetical protein
MMDLTGHSYYYFVSHFKIRCDQLTSRLLFAIYNNINGKILNNPLLVELFRSSNGNR